MSNNPHRVHTGTLNELEALRAELEVLRAEKSSLRKALETIQKKLKTIGFSSGQDPRPIIKTALERTNRP